MAKLRNFEYYGFPEQKEFQGIKTQYSIKNDEQDTEIATLIENKLDKGEAKKTYASIEKTVSDIVYLGDEKKIVFNDANGNELGSINASEFIKDGMVSDVKIDNDNLVIAFNTDSGHDEISISLSDIFDPNNYYIKEDVDDALKLKTDDNEFKTFVSQNANEHTSLLTAIGKVKEDIDTELSNKLDVSTFNEYSGVVDTKLEEKALQSDLEALSGKSVTEITSDGSIGVTKGTATDGTVTYEFVTDASKVKLNGLTMMQTPELANVNSNSTVTSAIQAIDKAIDDKADKADAELAKKLETVTINGHVLNTGTTEAVINGAEVKLDGYTIATANTAVAATDAVNDAIAKVEYKADHAGDDALNEIKAGNGIDIPSKADGSHEQTVSIKLAPKADGLKENPLTVDANGLKFATYLDAGEY